MGHIIYEKEVAMDMEKVSNMLSWPVPRCLKELRGFLGQIGYYQKFVWGYASVAKPLTEKLQKDAFRWNDEALAAFEALKRARLRLLFHC